MLDRWLDELDERNLDNVSRTESYLELYAFSRKHPPELPWVLMAHLVSRNAGYLMTDLFKAKTRNEAIPGFQEAATNLFELLERANYVIFYAAWHHVITYLSQGVTGLEPGRTTAWVRQAWQRFSASPDERTLVLDLVTNEQNLIERRVVHHPRFAQARVLLAGIEASGREKPIALPGTEADIRVGDFASLSARIEAGRRLYDEVLANRVTRDRLFDWAMAHPHTGSREVLNGRSGATLWESWPLDRVRAAWPEVHGELETDPAFP